MSEKIILYKDQNSLISQLTDEEAGQLLKAIYDYSINDGNNAEEILTSYFPNADRLLKGVWGQIQEKLDYNARREAEISQKQSQNSRKRWDKANPRKRDTSERIPSNATASESIPPHTVDSLTYTYTNTNNSHHTIGRNGKPYRRTEDGTKVFWDTGEIVPDGWESGDNDSQ